MILLITIRVTVNWNKPFDRARRVWFFDGLRIYSLMINYLSKDGTYFKEEKTLQNRRKSFENQQSMFFIVRFRNDPGPVSNAFEIVPFSNVSFSGTHS